MFDSIRWKLSRESTEPTPKISRYGITGSFCHYDLLLDQDKPLPEEVVALANEFVRIMAERKISYQTALYLPKAMRDILHDSFCWQVFSSILQPLPNDGHDQGDNGNDKSEN